MAIKPLLDQRYLGKVYQSMAEGLLDALPYDWTHVALCFLPSNAAQLDQAHFQIFCKSGEESPYTNLIDDVAGARPLIKGPYRVKRMCSLFAEECKESGHAWTMFSLSIYRSGRFKADFSYKPMKAFTKADLIAWQTSVFR